VISRRKRLREPTGLSCNILTIRIAGNNPNRTCLAVLGASPHECRRF
jgi:hypothetical protein